MDGAFKMAAFIDDWNNFQQTIADSLQSNSSAPALKTLFPSQRIQWMEGERKKAMETTSAAIVERVMIVLPSIAIWIFSLSPSTTDSRVSTALRRHIRALKLRSVNLMTEKRTRIWSGCDCSDLFGLFSLSLSLSLSEITSSWYSGSVVPSVGLCRSAKPSAHHTPATTVSASVPSPNRIKTVQFMANGAIYICDYAALRYHYYY